MYFSHSPACYLALCLIFLAPPPAIGWGFCAHRKINEHAIFLLPLPLFRYFKEHHTYLRDKAIDPDKRRYVVPGEAAHHYIDLEYYQREGRRMPYTWYEAVDMHGEEMLAKHGKLPWHILLVMHRLTEAFRAHDSAKILRHAADLGHYAADACTPLHTTENHDGQFTCQEGIHGLWETDLPERFVDGYDLCIGSACYIPDPLALIWEIVWASHAHVPFLLAKAEEVEHSFPTVAQYTFEQRGALLRRVPSREYALAYHQALEGQVERQMRQAIHLVASLWFTCWVHAGSPPLPLAST